MPLRVLISADMEGVAGVAGRADVLPGAADYGRGRRLLTDEVNAAARGALAHDPAAEVRVSEGHGDFRNVIPQRLDPRVRLVHGSPKPELQLTGVADGVDVVLLIGYHGRARTARAVLAHTLAGAVMDEVRLDGCAVGELALNIAYAAALGATTVLVSGDDATAGEAAACAPGITTVAVKRALGGLAVDTLHPAEACERIERAVPAAIAARHAVAAPRFDGPVTLEIDLARPVIAESLLPLGGLEPSGPRTVRYAAPAFIDAYRVVVAVAQFGAVVAARGARVPT